GGGGGRRPPRAGPGPDGRRRPGPPGRGPWSAAARRARGRGSGHRPGVARSCTDAIPHGAGTARAGSRARVRDRVSERYCGQAILLRRKRLMTSRRQFRSTPALLARRGVLLSGPALLLAGCGLLPGGDDAAPTDGTTAEDRSEERRV